MKFLFNNSHHRHMGLAYSSIVHPCLSLSSICILVYNIHISWNVMVTGKAKHCMEHIKEISLLLRLTNTILICRSIAQKCTYLYRAEQLNGVMGFTTFPWCDFHKHTIFTSLSDVTISRAVWYIVRCAEKLLIAYYRVFTVILFISRTQRLILKLSRWYLSFALTCW